MNMTLPSELTDQELRAELSARGMNVGPISSTTRSVYEKHLISLRSADKDDKLSPMASHKKSNRRKSSPSRSFEKSLAVHISDAELRMKLMAEGVNVGPITSSTRGIYRKQLASLLSGESSKSPTSSRVSNKKKDGKETNKRSGSSDLTFQTDEEVNTTVDDIRHSRRSTVMQNFTDESTPLDKTNKICPDLADFPSAPRKHISDVTPVAPKENKAPRPPTPPRPTLFGQAYKAPKIAPTNYFRNDGLDAKIHKGLRNRWNLENFRDSTEKREKVISNSSYDDEDDHMESSRILSHHALDESLPSKRKLSRSWFRSLINMLISSRKAKATNGQNYMEGRHYQIPPSTQRPKKWSFDISRILLYVLAAMIAFFLLAYVLTANADGLALAGHYVYDAGKRFGFVAYTYAILPLFLAIFAGGSVFIFYYIQQYRKRKAVEEKRQVYDFIEKITDMIRSADEHGRRSIAEPHARDMLIPATKRSWNSPELQRWNQAVKFINLHESRVRTETRLVNGTECIIWHWLPAKHTGWQGNG